MTSRCFRRKISISKRIYHNICGSIIWEKKSRCEKQVVLFSDLFILFVSFYILMGRRFKDKNRSLHLYCVCYLFQAKWVVYTGNSRMLWGRASSNGLNLLGKMANMSRSSALSSYGQTERIRRYAGYRSS